MTATEFAVYLTIANVSWVVGALAMLWAVNRD